MAGEDEFALAPFVADAFVEGEGGDAVGVVVAVADVLVEEDLAVEGCDDEAGGTGQRNVACYVVDFGSLDGYWVASMCQT